MKNKFLIIICVLLVKLTIAQSDSLSENLNYKEFYYTNGKIASRGYLKNDKPTGYWISYYITGIKKSEGKWNNNKLDSTWIFYDQLGDTTEKISYYLGLKNGYHYQFFRIEGLKNKIKSKELYLNDKRNSKSIEYYNNGVIKKTIPFVDDQKHGLGFEYDKNENIITITRYRNNKIIVQEYINRNNADGEKEGVWKEFYENGNLKEEKNYIDGKLNGYYKIYNEEGKLLNALKYKDGKVDLESKDNELSIEIKEEYDNDGNLIYQGSYNKNIPIGIHQYFNKDGNVIKSKTYNIYGKVIAEGIVLLNGKEDGDWIYYHKNGKKSAIGKYNKGKKQGKWTYYYKNGKVQQVGSYASDKLTGLWSWYYETGELLKEEYYIYGELDGEVIEYTELGNIISKGNYIEGYKEGKWLYIVGDQKNQGKYVTDYKDGKWESYYIEEDKLSFEGRYVQGNPDGKHVYYYPNGQIKEERYYEEGQKVRSWSKYNERGDLVVVVQYKEGNIYKINGVKIKFDDYEN